MANFTLMYKEEEGNNHYDNISKYNNKVTQVENFNKVDFVKVFGDMKASKDEQGKDHNYIKLLRSKMIKFKEQMK